MQNAQRIAASARSHFNNLGAVYRNTSEATAIVGKSIACVCFKPGNPLEFKLQLVDGKLKLELQTILVLASSLRSGLSRRSPRGNLRTARLLSARRID
jgi:hypothetical protein